jgi:hypothetical protein
LTGRPTKCTPKVVERICLAVSKGCTYELAAQAAGIDVRTFHDWKARAAKGEEPFSQFLQELEKAEGLAAEKNLEIIGQAASGGAWQAAAWKLERRHPRDYGRHVHEITGKDDGPLQIRVVE